MRPKRSRLAVGLLCLSPAAIVTAGTHWPSLITNAVTWTAAGSPHTWSDTLTIGSGGVVTIEPGATVTFAASQYLDVNAGGRILALGSAEAPIRIGGISDTAKGARLTLNSAETCEFRFCHFANLSAIVVNSALPQANHLFEHCIFRKFSDHVVQLANAPARVLHCIFRDNATDRYGVAIFCDVFTDETCPTIWYNAFEGNGLLVAIPNYTTLAMNDWDFFRFNRVGGGTGVALGGERSPSCQRFCLLDCDLGAASPSVHVFAQWGWAGGVDGRIERCHLSRLTQYSQNVGGLTNLSNNYWGTTNLDEVAVALFEGVLSTNVALPISTTNLFPQADVDGSDQGNRTRQADADLVKRAIVGLITLSPEQTAIADVDRNGIVDARDALLVESYINNLIWKLPVP